MAAIPWPTAAHFAASMQNPQIAFRNAELQRIRIARNPLNQPRAWAGQFANVYQGVFPNGHSRAVRVFTSPSPERRERYQAIDAYLNSRRPNCLVQFTYEEKGVRSAGDGKWYPLVTMDWVEGDTLYQYLRVQCLRGNGKAVERLCELWIGAVGQLTSARIAHGDLQHGNVMVAKSGEIKLVDYDCMCVPALEGRRNLEIGVAPYQHPARNENTLLTRSLDNFSAIFILAALKALAAEPALWERYIEKDGYEKLLFRGEDLHNPRNSQLIRDLMRSRDGSVSALCNTLVELVRMKLEDVPRLEDAIFRWPPVESFLNQRDFDSALELLMRSKKRIDEAPLPLQPRLRNAEERIRCRLAVEKAVQSGDEHAMQQSYLPRLLDDYPRAQPVVAVARQAVKVIPILERLEEEFIAKQWRQFVKVWEDNQTLLAGRSSAGRFEEDVRKWKARNGAWDALQALFRSPNWDPVVAMSHWRLAQESAEAAGCRVQIEQTIQREAAWKTLQGQLDLDPATENRDRFLVHAWKKYELLFQGWDRAQRERPKINAAGVRLAAAGTLHTLEAQPVSLAAERRIAEVGRQLSPGYSLTLDAQGVGVPAAGSPRPPAQFAPGTGVGSGHRRKRERTEAAPRRRIDPPRARCADRPGPAAGARHCAA